MSAFDTDIITDFLYDLVDKTVRFDEWTATYDADEAWAGLRKGQPVPAGLAGTSVYISGRTVQTCCVSFDCPGDWMDYFHIEVSAPGEDTLRYEEDGNSEDGFDSEWDYSPE